MPVVQSYVRQIGTQQAATSRRSHVAIGQLDRPMMREGRSAESYGAGFAALGADIALGMHKKELAKQDQVRGLQVDRKMSDWEIANIYDREHGALGVVGEKAYELGDTVPAAYDKAAAEATEGLNDRQRRQVQERLASRRASVLERITGHIAAQGEIIDKGEYEATINNAASIAIQSADDLRTVGEQVDFIYAKSHERAARLGLPAGSQARKNFVAAPISATHVAVINRFLDKGQDIQAKVYLEYARDEIDGTQVGALEKQVSAGSVLGESQRLADAIMKGKRPLGERMAEVYKIADPKIQEATGAQVKARVAIEKEDETMAANENESRVWQMSIAGTSAVEIQQTPEYRALTGDRQNVILEHMDDRGQTLTNRAQSAADYLRNRAWESESRGHTRAGWAKDRADTKAYERYEEITSDPAALAAMTPDEILTKIPELGRTLTTDLLAKNKALRAEGAVKAATIDTDLFNTIADAAGVTEKGKRGALRAQVEASIDARQRGNKNVALDYEQKRELMQGMVDTTVMQDVWGFDKPEIAALADPKKSYVPLAQIPQSARTTLTNIATGYGTKMTNDKMQRAYAAAQMRDDALLESILKEQ